MNIASLQTSVWILPSSLAVNKNQKSTTSLALNCKRIILHIFSLAALYSIENKNKIIGK
jgi:hypothetical protein